MKTKSLFAFLFLTLSISGNTFSSPCGYSSGDCQFGTCEFNNKCQCTDPACWRSYDRDCSSKTTCCEAFGNVGAR